MSCISVVYETLTDVNSVISHFFERDLLVMHQCGIPVRYPQSILAAFRHVNAGVKYEEVIN